MEIIGGRSKGKRLRSLRRSKTRPILARVKEALFAILQDKIEGASFLDLYAGTGGVGIEALSRGAKECLFVERDSKQTRVIRENLRRAKLEGEVNQQDVFSAIKTLGQKGKRFDLIFLGPPYGGHLVSPTLACLAAAGILLPGGTIIAQHHKKEEIPAQVEGLSRNRQEGYGESHLSFFVRERC